MSAYASDSEPEGSHYPDSDGESLIDVDSPADGYFERRDHPQATYMPNPSMQDRSEEDKAREATSERLQRQRQPAGPSVVFGQEERERPPSHYPRSRDAAWTAHERTPLLDAGPAGPPPDYAAATADRRRGSAHGREGSFGSMSEDEGFASDHPLVRNGLFGGGGALAERPEPQSMRDEERNAGLRGGGMDEEGLLEDRGANGGGTLGRLPQRGEWNGRRRWTTHFRGAKRWLGWLALIGVLTLILLVSGLFGDAQENGKYPSDGNGRQMPTEPADGGDDDPVDESPILPPHHQSSQCYYRSFSKPERFSFTAPGNFSFLELIESPTERALFNNHITGTIQVSIGDHRQENDIEVWVSVAVSGPWKIGGLRRIKDDRGIELLLPDVNGEIGMHNDGDPGRWKGRDDSCMDISLGLAVRPGTQLRELDINTASLDVEIEHGVFDRVSPDQQEKGVLGPALTGVDTTTITTVRGRISAEYLDSRATRIETTSSSIRGTYALRDLLSVRSTSGSIDLRVDPKEVSASDPQPADFCASSNSGSINVGYLFDSLGGNEVPERDYRTKVETHSSHIGGSYVFTSDATFSSNSGSLDLNLLPYYADQKACLRTDSGSAHTDLRLLPPYKASPGSSENPHDVLLDELRSSHKSTSGSLHLKYPEEWDGIIDGESISGSIHIEGEGVEVIVDESIGGVPGRRRVLRHVTARKGSGDSEMGFGTRSGSVSILVGKNE